ncbi:MAG: hypothetical protein NVS9B11_21230 [Candidatus Dormibacteraceae bacterium]
MIEDDQGMRLRGLHRWLGVATNNEAEYHALIEGKPDRLEIFLDSKLVAEQVKGNYRVKEPRLQRLHLEAKELLGRFAEVEIKHVEREKNKGADALANMAIDAQVKKGSPRG